jgi:hypothetical protein
MSRRIVDFSINPDKLQNLNKFILQEGFNAKLAEVGKLNISLTQKPTQVGINIDETLTSNNSSLDVIDTIKRIILDPKKGQQFSGKVTFGGYDESKLQFVTLEGTANITSHSLVEITRREFIPIGYITVYFYTRSNDIVQNSKHIKYSLDSEADSNRDYAEDRNFLIQGKVLENSILFIDGPFIGGNITGYSLRLIEELHNKNVIPVFFVKNSNSNLVIDNLSSIKNKYNSDLHWSYNYLQPGERSNFFKYTDKVNPKNTKLFCYIKPFDRTSPQRIEIHPETFELYEEYIDELFYLIYYLMLVQGDKSNPQIRPIAIAEKYAREMIKTVNIRSLLKNTSLVSTIDQERFGG